MEKFDDHKPNKFGFRCEKRKMSCNYCKKKGHIEVACKKKKDTELAKSGRVTVKDVVVRRILSKEVKDDYSKLPNMEGCLIEPIVYKNGKLIQSQRLPPCRFALILVVKKHS